MGGSSYTLVRTTKKAITQVSATESELKDMKRKQVVNKESKDTDCLYSDDNMCQAWVNSDLSKRPVQKAKNVKTALDHFLDDIDPSARKNLIFTCTKKTPNRDSIALCIIENAGWKFKVPQSVTSVNRYLAYTRDKLLVNILHDFQHIKRIVLVEEKYYFTPDDFKAQTRLNRQSKANSSSISNLKTAEEICNEESLQMKEVTTTAAGKTGIGNVCGSHGGKFNLKRDVTVDVDCEWLFHRCLCSASHVSLCICDDSHKAYATPVRYDYKSTGEEPTCQKLNHIRQRKGEAEMGQVDWLKEALPTLNDDEAVLSAVTSGDVDSLIVHMLFLSYGWPRKDDGDFKHPVYVWLLNPGKVYLITGIIRLIEKKFGKNGAMKVALALSMAGNDFLPQFYFIAHNSFLKSFMAHPNAFDTLFKFEFNHPDICTRTECTSISLDYQTHEDFVKYLYTEGKLKGENASFELVRLWSMKNLETGKRKKDPMRYMPPKSCVRKHAKLVECYITYMLTTGNNSKLGPNFMESGCLKICDGVVRYNFGDDSHTDPEKIDEYLMQLEEQLPEGPTRKCQTPKKRKPRKRQQADTPQKGHRRKQMFLETSTPNK